MTLRAMQTCARITCVTEMSRICDVGMGTVTGIGIGRVFVCEMFIYIYIYMYREREIYTHMY